ncbi:MAG: response regulator transcription factor [Candidatus Acidiferrum sp.]
MAWGANSAPARDGSQEQESINHRRIKSLMFLILLLLGSLDRDTLVRIWPHLLMKRHVLIYGLIGGVLIAVLKWTEYRFLVIEHSVEIYGGLTAATFAVLGIWLGLKLTGKQERIIVKEIPAPAAEPFVPDDRRREELSITPREMEILGLIAQSMSNREIAEKLYVSENTVKTHSSRVFDKLGAKRRTQAVQRGKEFGLLP